MRGPEFKFPGQLTRAIFDRRQVVEELPHAGHQS